MKDIDELRASIDCTDGKIVELLKERGLTLATAESCTAGLISKRITDISGASAVFSGRKWQA